MDPFRLSDAVYATSFEQIAAAADTVVYTIVMNGAVGQRAHNGLIT